MHTANAVPTATAAAAADFIPINGAAFQQHQPHIGRHVHHHAQHHHHQRHFQQQPEQHTSNRFKRKREGSGEPAPAPGGGGGGEAAEGPLRQPAPPPPEMESPALRSPWVPPRKSYVNGILG